jgi:hypothetical protein
VFRLTNSTDAMLTYDARGLPYPDVYYEFRSGWKRRFVYGGGCGTGVGPVSLGPAQSTKISVVIPEGTVGRRVRILLRAQLGESRVAIWSNHFTMPAPSLKQEGRQSTYTDIAPRRAAELAVAPERAHLRLLVASSAVVRAR